MSNTVRTRIAPSPTGFPHIGTVFQALFDYVYARQHQGQFIIRLEDTDRQRLIDGSEAAIYRSLEWAGLKPDEGPIYGGEFGPYRQSERLDIYHHYAQKLIDAGQAYYCFCSPERLDQIRKNLQKQGKPPMYDKLCRHLDPKEAESRAQSEAHVIRMKIPDQEIITFTDLIRGPVNFDSRTVDDQVILKSDGYPTYHLGVVVDDYLMGITHIVRGEEWISSTPKHILLYRYFGWEVPAIIHTPLLRNPDRSKLSKRHGHSSVSWYQEQGYLVEAVINFLASRVWNHPEGKEVYGVEEIIKHFKWEEMHISGPIIDLKKLDWLNGQWLRGLTDADLTNRLKPFKSPSLTPAMLKAILPHIRDRLVKLSDLNSMTKYLYQDPPINLPLIQKQARLDTPELTLYLTKVVKTLEPLESWDAATIESALRRLQTSENLKPRPAFMTVRVALTGLTATPPLFDIMTILGKSVVLKRLSNFLNV
jgi:glutamyl-tRNA synthetase